VEVYGEEMGLKDNLDVEKEPLIEILEEVKRIFTNISKRSQACKTDENYKIYQKNSGGSSSQPSSTAGELGDQLEFVEKDQDFHQLQKSRFD